MPTSLIGRDLYITDVLDRIETLERAVRLLQDYSIISAEATPEEPIWAIIGGWVFTGDQLHDINRQIILDPTVPKIEIVGDGYLEAGDGKVIVHADGFSLERGAIGEGPSTIVWYETVATQSGVAGQIGVDATSNMEIVADGWITLGDTGSVEACLALTHDSQYVKIFGGDSSNVHLRVVGGTTIGADSAPGAMLDVIQPGSAAAIPVIELNQADIDKPFINFVGGYLYANMTAANEYVRVSWGGATKYLRLYT